MEKHFVTFYSPGTFVSETSTSEIETWDVDTAIKMSTKIKERHGARPYGFKFTTRSRGEADLDSKVSASSCMYYLGGVVQTLEEVLAINDPNDHILLSNMQNNDIKRIIVNTNSYKITLPLNDDDIVLP